MVGQDRYRFEKVIHLGIGATDGKTKAVALARPGRDIPELSQVLKEDDQLLAAGKRFLNEAKRLTELRGVRLRGIEQQIGIAQNH
jgi:hypothetical protein